jgi:hypothetical protein
MEKNWRQVRQAKLTIVVGNGGPSEEVIRQQITSAGYHVRSLAITYETTASLRELHYSLRWRATEKEVDPPRFLASLATAPSTTRVAWEP